MKRRFRIGFVTLPSSIASPPSFCPHAEHTSGASFCGLAGMPSIRFIPGPAVRYEIETDASISLVWKDRYLAHQHEVFADDPWVYGLEKNRHVIAKFLSYAYDQGVSAREMSPEELFFPSTVELAE